MKTFVDKPVKNEMNKSNLQNDVINSKARKMRRTSEKSDEIDSSSQSFETA